MTVTIARTADAWFVVSGDVAARVDTQATTTAQLLADADAIAAARQATPDVAVSTLQLVSPVTRPCRVIAQMTNYASHASDAGMDPATVPLTFFRKSSASISGPTDAIVKPSHVRLLDYEVEIGIVIGRDVPAGSTVTARDLPGIVRALVITNDVSARDVQLVQTQFYEAKSYPTFTPTGPYLVLLDDGELDAFEQLQLRLWVDGDLRQDMPASDMIYKPLETLQSLTAFQDLAAGDLLLTGTPIGTALQAPPKIIEKIGALLPVALKWKIFFGKQAKNPRYLRDGNLVEVAIKTDDGSIDLGTQRMSVRSEP
jgi:2-keto-4-pentenoate hydratase/2-oxohepta-3-ene-1,7-dioic acid hydratase in catechol pathway